MQLYKRLAQTITARDHANSEWFDRHQETIDKLMESAPRGSGFDSGTTIYDFCGGVLRLETSFHHMNDNGMYDGWTERIVTVKPNLVFDFILTISGRNRNGIKEYIAETFYTWLTTEVD